MHASMWPTSTHSVNWTVKLEYRLGRFADWNPLYFISLILFFFRQSRHVFQSMQWSQLRMESYFRSCGMFWAQGNVFCIYVVFWIIAGGMLLFSSNWFEWLAGMNLASTTKHIMTILLMRYFLHQTYPRLTSWTLQSEKTNCNYFTESTLDFLFVSVQLKERWAESCHHAHVSIRWCGRWWNLFSIGADFFYHLSLNARTLEQLNVFPFASMIGLEVYQSRPQILVSETKVSRGCSFCWLHF